MVTERVESELSLCWPLVLFNTTTNNLEISWWNSVIDWNLFDEFSFLFSVCTRRQKFPDSRYQFTPTLDSMNSTSCLLENFLYQVTLRETAPETRSVFAARSNAYTINKIQKYCKTIGAMFSWEINHPIQEILLRWHINFLKTLFNCIHI